MQQYDLVVIGGGVAGIMAAITAKEKGIENILLLERENTLGGALNEYIHNGFGLKTLKEELTGPEFAQRLIDKIKHMNIKYKLNAMVLDINKDKILSYVSNKEGIVEIKAKAVIIATGCRERPRGVMNIPKSRCAGIVTAGSAQKFVNLEGYLPGKEVVVMGSGDMGAIISRRLILEGAKIKAVVEHMPYVTACDKNIVQCFKGFDIPLMLSHTVVEIKGKDRVEGVVVTEVDKDKNPIVGTEKYVSCDALIFSMGLYPENELAKRAGIELSNVTRGPKVDQGLHTNIPGIFTCGAALHVHNMVDDVIEEARIAAEQLISYLKSEETIDRKVEIIAGDGIKYVVPTYVNFGQIVEDIKLSFKADDNYKDSEASLYIEEEKALSLKKQNFNVGNIENIVISKEELERYKECNTITLKIDKQGR